MEKNVLIVHHTDNDGHMSASICVKWAKRKAEEDGYDVNIDHVDADYKDTLAEICKPFMNKKKYDTVYVVDVSITRLENASFLVELLNEGVNVIYIDHHLSTIKFMDENHNIMNTIDGIVVTGISASMICWIMSEYTKSYSDFVHKESLKLIVDEMMEVCGTEKKLDRSYVEYLAGRGYIPIGLEYVDAYDIWDKNTHLGWSSVLEFAVNDLSVEDCEQLLLDETGAMFTDLLERGALIKQYEDKHNELLCKQFGYEASVVYNKERLSVFCLNNPISDSNTFGDRIEKYDILCAYYFNGKNWTHSFYSTKHDCSVLCKLLGGGGHPGASGFQIDEPLLLPGKEYDFDEMCGWMSTVLEG